jgi:uncharacterized protein (TIGR02284 family)
MDRRGFHRSAGGRVLVSRLRGAGAMTDSDLPTDAAELQAVLTRYVDSCNGYRQAADVMEDPRMSADFRQIARRRERIVERVADLIRRQGEKADLGGSAEAQLHRWWIQLRAELTTEELRATLQECIRGERELFRTVDDVLKNGELSPDHAGLLHEVVAELRDAILTFETALGR